MTDLETLEIKNTIDRPRVSESNCESELVDLARRGNTAAWDLLVIQTENRLRMSIARLVPCSHLADDIVQETLIRALDNLEKFRGDSVFYTWVFRIALNLRTSYLRKFNRELVSLDALCETASVSSDPAGGLLESEHRSEIRGAMQNLVGIHRQVLRMKFYEDLDYATIAELLSVEVGTVKSRISRAKQALRDQLSDHHHNDHELRT